MAVEGAQAQLASMLTQTRGVALTKRANARLIIHDDLNANPERYLRFAGIVYDANTDGDGNPVTNPNWLAATDGITLPSQAYAFVDDFANMNTTGFSLDYLSNSAENYAYIEFTSNGTVALISGESPRLAVSSGQPDINPTTGQLSGIDRNENNVRGAIIRRYGAFVLLNENDAFPNN